MARRVWHWVARLRRGPIGATARSARTSSSAIDVVIGNNVKIQNNVSVYDAVTLEDDVFCGPSMVFTNVYNPRAAVSAQERVSRYLVRRGATLGANCTMVCGDYVGDTLSSAPARWSIATSRISRWWPASRRGRSAG